MKLHLPKMLLTAVLAACSTAYAFGPQEAVDGEMTDVEYTEITTVTNGAQSPTVSTYYSNVENDKGTISITTPEGADKVHIKLGIEDVTGTEDVNELDKEATLGTISAASTWIAEGRFNLGSANAVANAGDLYVNGGALHIGAGVTIQNNITLGTSTYASDSWKDHSALNSAALIVGLHSAHNQDVTLSGNLTIAEDAKICMQSGYNLTLTGDLVGTKSLEITRFSNDKSNNNDGDNTPTRKDSVITLSGSAEKYTGNITVSGGKYNENVYTNTLKLNAVSKDLITKAESITVGDYSTLDLTEAYGGGVVFNDWKSIEDKVTTTEGGLIKIKTKHEGNSRELKLGDTGLTLNNNYQVDGRIDVHGQSKDDGRALVLQAGSLKSNDGIIVVSDGNLKVTGADLECTYIRLGHEADPDASTGGHYGTLVMTGGSIKTEYLSLYETHTNSVSITGGTLEFTGETALKTKEDDTNVNSTVHIGGTGDTSVTLKATASAWEFNRNTLADGNLTLGNVTIDSTNAYAIKFTGANLVGNIVNNKLLSLGSGVTVAAGATASLSGAGTTTIEQTLSNSGSLTVGGTIQIFGNFDGHYEEAGSEATLTGNLSCGGNGFAEYVGYSSWYLVKDATGENISSTLSEGTTLTNQNYTLAEVDGGIVIKTAGSTYYDCQSAFAVNAGVVNVAALLADSTSLVTADTKYALNGGELAVTTGTLDGSKVDTTSNVGGVVSVATDATLTNANNLASIAKGGGTIELSFDTSYDNNKPNASSNFTGTTHVKAGNFTINDATFGNKLVLDNGVNFQLTGGSNVTLASSKELVLNGESQIHQNTSNGKGANLTFEGIVSGTGTYDRRGGGTLTFNNSVTLGSFWQKNSGGTSVFNGNLVLSASLVAGQGTIELGSGTHSVATLDASNGGESTATVTLKEGASLTARSILGAAGSAINLKKGASLTHGAITIKGTDGENTSSITASKTASYLADGTDAAAFSISNATITVNQSTNAGYILIGNKLNNSSVVNEGSDVVIVRANVENFDISDIEANKGNVNLVDMQSTESLNSLKMEAGMKVGAHTAYTGIGEKKNLGTLSVVKDVTMGSGSVVEGHLILGDSITLNLNGFTSESSTAVVEGDLSLAGSLTLGGDVLKAIMGIEEGGTLDILTIGGDLIVAGEHISTNLTADNGIVFTDLFSNTGYDDYYLGYTLASGDGSYNTLYIGKNIPEPTTATLSLLALAGLAARRRRK